jgi:predicted  nucleic acid-binding Zn-ribbon protein
MSGQAPLDSFSTGTLAGAGCFRCGTCGFAVALHERDEVPACPHCGGEDFRRSSIFGELELREPTHQQDVQSPPWLDEARDALERAGDYLAWDHNDSLRVVALKGGWTRVGRSLAADIRFDHPTVSRRHAMLHRSEEGVARVLDDRSLNGVFVNGERIDMKTLADGDEVTIGRFRLYFLSVTEVTASAGLPGAFA